MDRTSEFVDLSSSSKGGALIQREIVSQGSVFISKAMETVIYI